MSDSISGYIQEVTRRKWKDKTFYGIKVGGEYYGTGLKKPKFEEGDFVEFEAEENDKGYMNVVDDTLEGKKGEERVSRNEKANGGARKRSMSKDEYWDQKNARDLANEPKREIGATRNTAIEWIKFLMANEAFPKLPAAAKREEFFNALLEAYIAKWRAVATEEAPAPTAEAQPAEVESKDVDEDEWQ